MPNDTTALRERLDRAGEQARLRDPSDLAKYVDIESVATDARGEIIGLDERLSDLRNTRPYLFRDGPKSDPLLKGRNLAKGLDVAELSAQEFEDVGHVLTTNSPDVFAIRRLEAAAKRQADARNDRRGLTRAI